MNHTFNNNNNNTNNNINNIDSNTNVTTTTTIATATITTTTTTTTMTNSLVSVSCSSNNDLQSNKHNNNGNNSNSSGNTTKNNNNNSSSSSSSKQNTLHLNTTTKKLLITENATANDLDEKANADAANADSANERITVNAIESTSANQSNSADTCDTVTNEKQKQTETDREQDLRRDSASNTNATGANTDTKQCQQQQTAITKMTTAQTITATSGAEIDKCDTEMHATISKNYSNSSGNQSSGGTRNNGNASLNFIHNTETTSGMSTNSKQLILNITEPHAVAITDDKLNSMRAHQRQRHSQRRLRTKALLDSLPQSLKMLGRAEQVRDYEALLAGSEELLQRLSINNPFYCFRKQSNSLKEMRALACSVVERRLRKVHSDTDIFTWQLIANVDGQLENDTASAPERHARILLECTGDALLGMRETRASVWHCYAPRKRGDTAVQLSDVDGSVVVVLDNKQTSIVSKPKSLNSLEELLSDSSAEEAEYNARGYLLDAVAAERAFAVSTHETDSSTVITNPFSIFLDDDMQAEHLNANARLRAASSASQQQRPLKKRQRSERSIRRLFDGGSGMTSAKRAVDGNMKQQTNENTRQHYLNGIPVSRFERQDFASANTVMTLSGTAKPHKLKPKHVFKNLSLRKMHKSASGLPATTYAITTNGADTISDLPQMKKLKITYPNRTQSIHSALDVSASALLNIALVSPGSAAGSGKHSYFERLQAKTRQGLQKLRDKCRNFKQASAGHHQYAGNGSGFSTLAKDDSFRFIGDRARISSYESKCAALNANASDRQQATIYKSYKSEIDLSKNLHYLDAYLEENFEQNLRSTKQSTHSVGRVAAGRLQRQRQIENNEIENSEKCGSPRYAKPLRGRTHKRSLSAAQKSLTSTEQRPLPTAPNSNNYENLGTLPISKRGCSDSLSSSDYASVFSGPTLAVEQATPVSSIGATEPITPSLADDTSSSAGLRYEHPKMSQYFYNKLAVEGSENLLLTADEHRNSEAATTFFNTSNEDDLTDSDFVGLSAGGDAALLVDYRRAANLDDSIRILVNEAEDKDFQSQLQGDSQVAAMKQQRGTDATNDWQRPQQEHQSATDERNFLLAYNENLAESHFYRSLNQHLRQQQQQKDVSLDVDGNGVFGIDAADMNERRDDTDLHYESYLEHFYRAKSGQHTRKANSIGYDDERVGTIGIENEDDGAEGGYVARSAFRRAARGRKAGGSAFELRNSALLLLGEQQSNKTHQDATTSANRAASYARQFYNFNVDINMAALAQKASACSMEADKVKMPMMNTYVATTKPLGVNSVHKNKQQQEQTLTFDGRDAMSLATVEHENERQLSGASNLYEAPKSTKNLLYASAAYDAYLTTTPNGIKATTARHFYNEDDTQVSTTAAGSKTPTKLQQQSGSGIKANIYLQAQPQAPATAASALYIDGKKYGGNPAQSMAVACGDANNRYMLDNMRRHYQPQQQQQQHQQKPTNSISSSLSLSTSSSSNSSVSQPMAYNQQQPQQQQQLLLPTTTTHGKTIKPQQHQPAHATSAYHMRRNSTASNASSSDNFDTFIALRSAQTTNGIELPSPAANNSAALQTDYLLSTKRTNIGNNSSNTNTTYQQQRQHMLTAAHTRTHTAVHYPTSPSSGGSSGGTVPLISALNYYGTSGGSSSHSDAMHGAYASSTTSASASASSSSSSSSTHHRYALTANASAIASNNYALLAQMHYASNKGAAAAPIGSADSAVGNACTTGSPISPVYASERKPFILEYEC